MYNLIDVYKRQQLHRGEILGFAGLMGAGRTELARLIFGADWRPVSYTHLKTKSRQKKAVLLFFRLIRISTCR